MPIHPPSQCSVRRLAIDLVFFVDDACSHEIGTRGHHGLNTSFAMTLPHVANNYSRIGHFR